MDNLDFNLEETEKKGDIYFSNITILLDESEDYSNDE